MVVNDVSQEAAQKVVDEIKQGEPSFLTSYFLPTPGDLISTQAELGSVMLYDLPFSWRSSDRRTRERDRR